MSMRSTRSSARATIVDQPIAPRGTLAESRGINIVKHQYKALAVAGAVVAIVAAGCSSSGKSSTATTVAPATTASGGSTATTGSSAGNTASAPGVTPTTVKVGFITSETGNAASTFSDAFKGAEAAFDAINNAGGIDGRKIVLVSADDQSTPTGDLAATQSLISQGVFMIENYSPYAFGGYKVAQQQGIPIVGGAFDGPEWGQQPNTNMFSYAGGYPSNGQQSANTQIANFFKLVGATNVGGLAYGISPSSTSSVVNTKKALEMIGLKMGYENLSVPFGGVDVTAYVLAMKQAGVDGAACSCVQSTNLALFTGLHQAGMNNVKALSYSSADSSLFSSATAAAAAQGAYYATLIPPPDLNNPAQLTFQKNVEAVDPSVTATTIPSFGLTGAYLAAEVGIEGLTVAGQNPTRQSFITNLTNVSSWNANGLLASSVGWNHFGTPEPTVCGYFVQVSGDAFKTINGGKPICGNSF